MKEHSTYLNFFRIKENCRLSQSLICQPSPDKSLDFGWVSVGSYNADSLFCGKLWVHLDLCRSLSCFGQTSHVHLCETWKTSYQTADFFDPRPQIKPQKRSSWRYFIDHGRLLRICNERPEKGPLPILDLEVRPCLLVSRKNRARKYLAISKDSHVLRMSTGHPKRRPELFNEISARGVREKHLSLLGVFKVKMVIDAQRPYYGRKRPQVL